MMDTPESIARLYGIFNGCAVDYGKCAGETGAHGAAAGILFAAEFSGTGAEHLGICKQFGMYFKTDNRDIIRN